MLYEHNWEIVVSMDKIASGKYPRIFLDYNLPITALVAHYCIILAYKTPLTVPKTVP